MRKARRRVGRFANVIPAEKTGRIIRIIWFPLIAAWIVLPIQAGLIPPRFWPLTPLLTLPILQWPAVAIALLAFLLSLMCWQKMGKSWRVGIDPSERTKLIVTGPYARIRHPIYALSSLLMLATAVIWPAPTMLMIAIAHLMLLQFEARREETHLIQLHGQIYEEYCRRTPRFIPAFSRQTKADG
jgi:protein-S-isoprenylcysteine O-methyltransferase Ste14